MPHSVCLGAGEMEGSKNRVGKPRIDSFLEEANMGISKQFTTVFKINIAFIHFLTS